MALQIKTGQNTCTELCTLHGDHNSYAETWEHKCQLPAASSGVFFFFFPTFLFGQNTVWLSTIKLNGFTTDMTDILNSHRTHSLVCSWFVHRPISCWRKKEEHDAYLDFTVIHVLKNKALHCLVFSGSCIEFYFVEKKEINYFWKYYEHLFSVNI